MNPLWLLKLFGWLTGANLKKSATFIVENFREILIVSLLCICGYQNLADTRFIFGSQTIPALEADLKESQDNLKVCGDGNAKLSTAIDESNERIREYAELSEKLKSSIVVLNTKLAKKRADTNKEVKVILKDPTPETCKAAMDYLRDAQKEIKW